MASELAWEGAEKNCGRSFSNFAQSPPGGWCAEGTGHCQVRVTHDASEGSAPDSVTSVLTLL